MMMAVMAPSLLHPDLSTYWWRAHLRAMLLLLDVPEGRDTSLALGGLLYLAYKNGNGNGDNGHCREGGGRRRQRWHWRQVPITPPPYPSVPGADG